MPPITLSELKKNKQQLAVEFGGGTISYEFRPMEFTPECEDLLREERGTLKAICRLVSSWDLLEKPNGKAVPLTVEGLAVVPSSLLNAMIEQMVTVLTPAREDKRGADAVTKNGSFTP